MRFGVKKKQVGQHARHGNSILHQVRQQFEEREDLGHHGKSDQQQKEIEEEA